MAIDIDCVGRDILVRDIVASARRNGAVLLFGGRQAGKTTALIHLSTIVNQQTADFTILGDIDVAIYVDLMTLPYDATPPDFFQLLFVKAISQCKRQITGFAELSAPQPVGAEFGLDAFIERLISLKDACGEVNAHLIFLLDESKRVLGDRFPRGFQDNLFTLLYGESAALCPPISMVFSGGQHLYRFSQDDTSPIGSRAGYQFVRNLSSLAVNELLVKRFPALAEPLLSTTLSSVMRFTGGQAGLVSKLLGAFQENGGCDAALTKIDDLEQELAQHCFGVFENWALALTSEGRAAWDGLVINQETTVSTISKILNRGGKDRFLAQRTLDELQYMGMAANIDGRIYKVNEAFAMFANDIAIESDFFQSSDDVPLWKLIENAELALREIIKKKYDIQFASNAEATMAGILGTESWAKISAMKAKSLLAYPYSRVAVERDSLSCMYFGNLMALMISNKTWQLFRTMFRDKRQIEDMINAIIPVRNDSAHFAIAPPKEMARCQVSCDDLLVIVEREIERMDASGVDK